MKFHVILGTLLFVGSGVAQAADMPAPQAAVAVMPQAPGSPWSVAIAPYVWASGISGDIGSFGLPPVHLDASFSDILKNFDIGAMFVGEIRYQRYGLFTDFIYVKISGSKGTPLGLAAGSVNVDTKTLTATIAPEYRLVETPRGSLDVMAGARIWSVDTDVSFSGGLLNGRSASDGDTWVDPLIGVKGRLDLGRNFYLTAWGMIGGFGVSSKFMWDAWGGVGYDFNNRISAVVGYRGLGVNYENGGFKYDITQYGPAIGAVIKF